MAFYFCDNKSFFIFPIRIYGLYKQDAIEVFVVQHLQKYLLDADFEEIANYIADQVNNASPNLSSEKAELADITSKINSGLRAVMSGMDFPELRDEIDRLRVRKSELEDMIAANERENKKVDPKAIVKLFEESVENWNDENIPDIVKYHIAKIYAHTDGTITVNVGVHIVGCGGRI